MSRMQSLRRRKIDGNDLRDFRRLSGGKFPPVAILQLAFCPTSLFDNSQL